MIRHFSHKKSVSFCQLKCFLLGVVTGGENQQNRPHDELRQPRVSESGEGRISVFGRGKRRQPLTLRGGLPLLEMRSLFGSASTGKLRSQAEQVCQPHSPPVRIG